MLCVRYSVTSDSSLIYHSSGISGAFIYDCISICSSSGISGITWDYFSVCRSSISSDIFTWDGFSIMYVVATAALTYEHGIIKVCMKYNGSCVIFSWDCFSVYCSSDTSGIYSSSIGIFFTLCNLSNRLAVAVLVYLHWFVNYMYQLLQRGTYIKPIRLVKYRYINNRIVTLISNGSSERSVTMMR